MIISLKTPTEDISTLQFYIPLTEIGFILLSDYSKPNSMIHTYHGEVATRKYKIDASKI